MSSLHESSVNLISESSVIEGKVILDQTARIHGTLLGELRARPGSVVILCESAFIKGNIHADTLIIDGFVRGEIYASQKVTISGTGRVVGNIHTRNLTIDFGAYFEGNCSMERVIDPIEELSTASV